MIMEPKDLESRLSGSPTDVTALQPRQLTRRLIEIEEVAEWLAVSKQRAYELARREIIPVVRIGRQVRVDPERLEEWIREGGSARPPEYISEGRV